MVFDNGDFKGQYSVSVFRNPYASNVHWTWVGSFYADGEGNITGGARLIHNTLGQSIWQTPVEQTFSGTYTVNPNGTGVARITVQSPPLPSMNGVAPAPDWSFYIRAEESFTFVLSDGGRELQLIWSLTRAEPIGVLPEPYVDHVPGEARRQDDACLRALGRLEQPFP
jgi:hypothetical protein